MAAEHQFDTVSALFLDRRIMNGDGDRLAIWTTTETFTYRRLYDLCCALAQAFHDAGIGGGDRIAFIHPDTPYYVAAIFGTIRLGAVAVPLSTRLTANDYVEICKKCGPRLVVLDDEHVALTDQLAALGAKVWSESDLRRRAETTQISKAAVSSLPTPRLSDPAVIQFTSGSTGRPKGVVHCHQNIIPITGTFPTRLNLQPDDRCYSVAKLSFGYGFANSLLFPCYAGASSVLDPRPPNPSTILEIAKTSQASVLFATPSIYAALLHLDDDALRAGLSSVRLCVSGGEHFENSLLERWRLRTGRELINGIGSTECLHIFISTIPGHDRPHSTGKIVPTCNARIVGEAGQERPIGEVGELWIHSPCNMKGYWNDPTATAAVLRDGWVRTADLFSRDQDDYFYYHGRADDAIKIRAQTVLPFEVEARLRQHPAVKECCVVGSTTKDNVAVLLAYVYLEAGHDRSLMGANALKRYLAEHLAQHKIPSRIEFVDDLPRTPTGKLDRRRLARSGTSASAT